ncbi:MAG: hypothetical protein RML56_14845 [Burkholderiales bacterium]|nr:hypothetical protein [Burkholderiales bacterium]
MHGEQGLGDDLFLLRFAVPLRERGARIEGAVLERLVAMVERSGVLDVCVPTRDRIPPAPAGACSATFRTFFGRTRRRRLPLSGSTRCPRSAARSPA